MLDIKVKLRRGKEEQMKVTKIMTDLLKRVEKKQTNFCNYSVDENYIYFTPDMSRIFKIY